jgi:hypothetical protein
MDIKNMMGVANVLAIFKELEHDAKQEVINELLSEGLISSIQWQDATKSKPPLQTPVYIKSGFNRQPDTIMAVWDGEVWFYVRGVYEELQHVSHFCIP